MKEELETMLQDFSSTRSGMTRQKDEVNQELERLVLPSDGPQIRDRFTQLQEFSSGFTGRIEETAETLQIEALKAIEKKLKDYESGFFPPVSRNLKVSWMIWMPWKPLFRMSMGEVSERVLNEFETFDQKMQTMPAPMRSGLPKTGRNAYAAPSKSLSRDWTI